MSPIKKDVINEDSLRDLRDSTQHTNIQITGLLEEERGRPERYLRRLQWKNCVTRERRQSIKSRKHRVPDRINLRKNTLRHIVMKLTKIKDKHKILKQQGKKDKKYTRGTPIRL